MLFGSLNRQFVILLHRSNHESGRDDLFSFLRYLGSNPRHGFHFSMACVASGRTVRQLSTLRIHLSFDDAARLIVHFNMERNILRFRLLQHVQLVNMPFF